MFVYATLVLSIVCPIFSSDSLDLHVLGPPTAIGLVAWSIASLRYKRFYWSKSCQMILILLSILALMVWAIRVIFQFGLGIQAFPIN